MYRPDRTLRQIRWLIALAGLAVMLWQRPATPVSQRGKLFLRIGAIVITVVAASAGAFFCVMTFSEADPWGRWVTAMLTFGLFGLPSSMLAIVPGAVMVKVAGASQETAQAWTAIFLVIAFFAQWLALAAALLRRSLDQAP